MRLYGRLVRLLGPALLRLVMMRILLGRLWKPLVIPIAVILQPLVIRIVMVVLVAILIVR